MKEFNCQSRGGTGVYLSKVTDKTGELVNVLKVQNDEEVMILNDRGIIIRIKTNDIRDTGRVAQGVKLINLNEEEKVISVSRITKEQIEAEQESEGEVSEETVNDTNQEAQNI